MAKTIRPTQAAPQHGPIAVPTDSAATQLPLDSVASLPRWLWPVLFSVSFLFYFFFSTRSDGFYQQDEAGHFLGMLDFWNDPGSILGNWAKFGYKLLYVVPAKIGGATLVTALNCAFAAGAALCIGLALQAQGSRYAVAGFALAAIQPLWIILCFRNYSEIPTAFLLALAYLLHVRRLPALSMLCVSYICTIRQEFYPMLGLYGLALLYQRRFVAAFAGAVFPLLQNVYGAWFNHGDYLYLYKQITGQAGDIANVWPRQGGEHYLKMAQSIFGPVAAVLAVQYLVWGGLRRQALDWYLVVPTVLFFLIQSIFNIQTVEIGPSTGGNLRYMLVISPMVAAMATLGLEGFSASTKRMQALLYLVPILLLTVLYLNYKSDLLFLLDGEDGRKEAKDGSPTLGVVLAIGLLYWQGTPAAKTWALAGGLALLALMTVRPIKLSEEDRACQQLAQWYRRMEPTFAGRHSYIAHPMFYYYMGKPRHAFHPEPYLLNSDNIRLAKKGDLVFWDSHYSYRPKQNKKAVDQQYFISKPQDWKLIIEPLVTPSQNFGVLVFERM